MAEVDEPFHPSQFAEHWETESHGYSRSKTYTKATDGHGNSDIVNVKIPPTVKAIIQGIVAKNGSFRSVPDFFRNAVMHEIHYLADNPQHPSLLPLDLTLADQDTQAMQAKIQEERDGLARLKELLDAQVQARDWDGVAHTISRYEGLADLTKGAAEELERVLEDYARELRLARRGQ